MSREQGRGDYRKRGTRPAKRGGGGDGRTLIGKPNEAITGPGILTSKTASVWLGPAHSPDEDTGRDVDIHYFLDDEATTSDYITISEPINGKRYVSLLTCPPEV